MYRKKEGEKRKRAFDTIHKIDYVYLSYVNTYIELLCSRIILYTILIHIELWSIANAFCHHSLLGLCADAD